MAVVCLAVLSTACEPSDDWIIVGGQMLDVVGGELRPNGAILIEDGTITAIVDSAEDPSLPAGLERVDAAGMTIVPGLWDNHAHVVEQDENGSFGVLAAGWEIHRDVRYKRAAYTDHGITSMRDPAGSSDLHALRTRLQNDPIDGPRFYSGVKFFTAPGGHPVPSVQPPWLASRVAFELDTPEAARAAVRETIDKGADFIHVIHSSGILREGEFDPDDPVIEDLPEEWFEVLPILRPEVLAAIVDEAAAAGLFVGAHVDRFSEAHEAIDLGVRYLEHTWEIPSGPTGDEFWQEAARLGVCWDPTLVVYASRAPTLATETNRVFQAHSIAPPDTPEAATTRKETVARAYEAGVRITVGTDSGFDGAAINFGEAVHEEMRLLVDAGMSPMDVWRAATITGADCLGLSERTGSIDIDKDADLVLFAGDPVSDLGALSQDNVRHVFIGGRQLRRP